jgi:hypothetical protein
MVVLSYPVLWFQEVRLRVTVESLGQRVIGWRSIFLEQFIIFAKIKGLGITCSNIFTRTTEPLLTAFDDKEVVGPLILLEREVCPRVVNRSLFMLILPENMLF